MSMKPNCPTMDILEEYRFKNIFQAMAFYRRSNPCRGSSRSLSCFEPDQGSSYRRVDNHPHDVYAAIIGALVETQKQVSPEQYRVFALYHIGETVEVLDRTGIPQEVVTTYGIHDTAKRLGVSKSTAFRHLIRVEDVLDSELVRRELIQPPDFTEEEVPQDGCEESRQAKFTQAEGAEACTAGSWAA